MNDEIRYLQHMIASLTEQAHDKGHCQQHRDQCRAEAARLQSELAAAQARATGR